MDTTKYYFNKSKAANTGMIGKGKISNTRINDMNATIKDGFQYSSVWSNEIDVIIIWSECTKFHQNLSMQYFSTVISSSFQNKNMAAILKWPPHPPFWIWELGLRLKVIGMTFVTYLPSFMLLPHFEQLFHKSTGLILLFKIYEIKL